MSVIPTHVTGDGLNPTLPPILEHALTLENVRAAVGKISLSEQKNRLAALSDAEIIEHARQDTFAIPAKENRSGYGGTDHAYYWLIGLGDGLFNNELIERFLGAKPSDPISFIDLGCSSGRVLRHVYRLRPGSRLMGCDFNPLAIEFIRTHLPSEIVGFHNVVFPPLPLASNSIDFLTANSVFTHIDEFEESWLLEIRRILRPGGVAFLTFHSERTYEYMKRPDFFLRQWLVGYWMNLPGQARKTAGVSDLTEGMPADRLAFTSKTLDVYNKQMFHSTSYVREKWGRLLDVETIIPSVHGEYQDGVVLRKPV